MRSGLLAVAVAVCGCAAAPAVPRQPASAGVKAYVAAVRADNPRAAYALLSARVRRDMSYPQFAARWRRTKPEREKQALALEEALKTAPDLGERAELGFSGGGTVDLAREQGEWHLEAALVSRVHAGRPRDAVKMLSAALERHDYDAVMRILTARRRDGIRHKVNLFISSLKSHQGDHIDVVGSDRAELRWDDAGMRYRIVLRKQGNEWRVDDVYMRPAPTK